MGGEKETEGEINECSLSSTLINLISGVMAVGWREDEMVEGADEKILHIPMESPKYNQTTTVTINTISDIASFEPTLNRQPYLLN